MIIYYDYMMILIFLRGVSHKISTNKEAKMVTCISQAARFLKCDVTATSKCFLMIRTFLGGVFQSSRNVVGSIIPL